MDSENIHIKYLRGRLNFEIRTFEKYLLYIHRVKLKNKYIFFSVLKIPRVKSTFTFTNSGDTETLPQNHTVAAASLLPGDAPSAAP